MLLNYTIHYDIAAVILLSILGVLYFSKRNIPSYGSKIFTCLIVITGVSAVCECVLNVEFQFLPVSSLIITLTGILYFCISNFLPFAAAAYCFVLSDSEPLGLKSKRRIALLILLSLLPYAAGMFWGVWNAVSPGKQRIDYSAAVTVYLLFVSLLYLTAGAVFLVKKYRRLPVHYFGTAFFFIVVVAAGAVVRLFFPFLLISNFCAAVSMYFLYMYIHKPDNFIDSLTGLFNTTAFASLIDEKFVRKDPFYVIGFVLEDLNFLNNTFGIRSIDELLKIIATFFTETAERFKKTACSDVYTIATDEFCIVVKTQDMTVVQSMVDCIREKFESVWDFQNTTVTLFSRICVIRCPSDAESAADILDLLTAVGEQQYYRARRVLFADSLDTTRNRLSRQLDRTIKTSIQNDLISVWYQPIYSISKRRVIGAEALIRMKDENGNFISPEDFIPIAEKNGTILRIGEFVLERVCSMLSDLNLGWYGIEKIDINLSMIQCMQKTLAEQIISITDIYRVPRRILGFEITETAEVYLPKMLQENMERLNSAGAECSLDDYGSGYSNMNYLIELPFNMIKIDKGIVWSADKKLRSRTALAHTITMIKSLGMQVLAEGVETKEQMQWLASLDCDYLQGYYFSKPLPQKDFLAFLAREMQRNGTAEVLPLAGELGDTIEDLEELEEAEPVGEL